jgi:hypothetical protein
MPNLPISGLPTASALDGTELLPFVQGGVTTQATVQDILDANLSVTSSGITLSGDIVPTTPQGANLGSLSQPFREIYLQSGSINIESDIPGGRRATISNADGNVTIEAAGFQLKSGSFVAFEVSETARTIIRSPLIPAGDIGAFSIIGNPSGSYQPVTNAGGLIHLTSNDGLSSRITSDAYGTTAFATYVGRKARGTAANPLPVQSNDTLSRISSIGWTGPEYGFTMSSSLTTAPTSLDVVALENFTTSSFGTAYRFFSTPLGSTTRNLSAQLDTTGLFVSGALSASLQSGYIWVGDSNNRTTTIPTSSFVTSAQTSSLQANWTSTSGSSQILNVVGPNGPTNVSIGKNVGQFTPPSYGVAIGSQAGQSNQGEYGVAIGNGAGQLFQGTNAVAIGSAGYEDQGQYAVAIGAGAGDSGQGQYAIAIGAGAGANHQTANSIILDATNGTIQQAAGAGFHVAPIRTSTSSSNLLAYNTSSKEITYSTLSFVTSTQTGSFYTTGSFGFYGAFCSTASQTNPTASVSRSMQLETTEHSVGVSIVSGSRITVAHPGTYNLQFSAQLEKTTNGVDHVYIWFKKNGTNVPRSNTNIDVNKQAGGNGRTVAAWNYVDTLAVNDYLEIVWQSDDTSMQLLAATATGNLPAIPSVIATLTQVS